MKARLFDLGLLMVVAGISSPALCRDMTPEERERELSVLTRTHPDYDPAGGRAGDFIYYPSLTAGGEYTDNVYSTDQGKVDDFVTTVAPAITVQSDFARHQVGAVISAESGTYQDIEDEDYFDYRGDVNGRFDITGKTDVPAGLSFAHEHSRRSSPDDRAGLEPTEYDVMGGRLGFDHLGQTVAVKIMANVDDYRFEDTRMAGGVINNQDRDRTESSLYASVGMANEGRFAPFVYSRAKDVSYDQERDDSGFERSATDGEVGVGTLLNFSGVTRSQVKVGYLNREFDDTRFSDIEAMTYAVDVTWEPSTLMAISLAGKKTIEETTLFNLSASVDSSLALAATYEVAPNIFLHPQAEVLEKSYEGLSDGEIRQYSGNLDLTYKMNRNLWSTLSYRHLMQDETVASPQLDNFDSNMIAFSLKFQY